MEEATNWLLNNIGDIAVIILYVLVQLLKKKLSKIKNTEVIDTVQGALDNLKESQQQSDENNRKSVKKMESIQASQQKQIEENRAEIKELTKLVTKVVDKRVD